MYADSIQLFISLISALVMSFLFNFTCKLAIIEKPISHSLILLNNLVNSSHCSSYHSFNTNFSHCLLLIWIFHSLMTGHSPVKCYIPPRLHRSCWPGRYQLTFLPTSHSGLWNRLNWPSTTPDLIVVTPSNHSPLYNNLLSTKPAAVLPF